MSIAILLEMPVSMDPDKEAIVDGDLRLTLGQVDALVNKGAARITESGAQCVCVPNSMASCYTGPQGTMGVGACAAGTALCDDQGLVLGPCTGEILPTAENCIAAPDEDCNGVAATCTGNSLWTKGFGDPSAQRVRGVALVQGGPVITGTFAGAVNFGGGALTSIGANGDLFVARYDALGNHLWSRRFGDASAQTGVSVAVTPQNEVVVVGDFAGTLVLGGATLTSLGQTDVFVAKFDAGGNPIWARAFGDPSAQTAGGVAIGSMLNGSSKAGDL